jgi:hypothetical protein
MATTWPDRVVRGTLIRAAHVNELRSAIDTNISQALPPMSPQAWSWTHPIGSGSLIRARYYTEMRDAIQRLWNNKGRGGLPGWSSGTTPGGPSNNRVSTLVRACDVTDLRRWLNQYEDNHPQQGVDSKSYDPTSGNLPLIAVTPPDNDWPQDLSNLSPKPLAVRCEIVARRDPTDPVNTVNPIDATDLARFRLGFDRYRARGHWPIALIDLKTYSPAGSLVDGDTMYLKKALDGAHTNPFINGFAEQVRSIAAALPMQQPRPTPIMVWNEPNGAQGEDISPQLYAAILWRCRQRLDELATKPELWWGGVIFAPVENNPDGIDHVQMKYVTDVYDTLAGWNVPQSYGRWPWNRINIHIHRFRSEAYIDNNLNELKKQTRDVKGDNAEIVIGEWGVTKAELEQLEQDPDPERKVEKLYDHLRAQADLMLFFSHHTHAEGADEWGTVEARQEAGNPGEFKFVRPGEPRDQTPLWPKLQSLYLRP